MTTASTAALGKGFEPQKMTLDEIATETGLSKTDLRNAFQRGVCRNLIFKEWNDTGTLCWLSAYRGDFPAIKARLLNVAPSPVRHYTPAHMTTPATPLVNFRGIAAAVGLNINTLHTYFSTGNWPANFAVHKRGRTFYFDAAIIQAWKDRRAALKNQSPMLDVVDYRQIAAALGKTRNAIEIMYRRKVWPSGFAPVTTYPKRFASGIIEALRTTLIEKALGVKNPDAVRLGKRGGLKGGAARAAKLTSGQRSTIASLAARKRWGISAVSQPAPASTPERDAVAIALIQNGFADAGLWLLKNQGKA